MEGFELPSKFRQWVFGKPMVNDVLGPEQFELQELPIPELKQGQALVRVKLVIFIPAPARAWPTG
jgi:NADPH:quinone reductase and related Zn-dependent oxidoreductases